MVTTVETKRSKGMVALAGAAMAWGVAYSLPQMSQAALLSNTVFNDTLASNGSSVQATGQSYPNTASPTATSTNYDVVSSKTATASNLTGGSPLELDTASTSSGITQVEALFTSSPVVLTTIGNAVEITTTFTNTAGILQSSSSQLDVGLYSSSGSTPFNNMENGSSTTNTQTGLNNNEINDNTGGVKGWVGYEADDLGTGSSDKMYQRPANPAPALGNAVNEDQDLIVEGQTGSYGSGTAATYIGQSAGSNLVVGDTYTDEMLITLTAAGTYTIAQALYLGSTDTGTQVGTTTSGTILSLPGTQGFDGLAIGYRDAASVAAEMDINQVEVTTNVAVPEPVSFSLLGISGLALMIRRRKA